MMSTFLPVSPLSHLAASSLSAMVADRPILLGSQCASTSNLCRQHSSCNPLSESMNECTSSMMTNLRSWKSLSTSSGLYEIIFCNDSGVICRIPEGSSMSLSLDLCEMSPCHPVTLNSESPSTGPILSNWSSMRALSGPIYNAPTLCGGLLYSEAMTGNSAASVFPLDVPADIRIWSSVE